MGSPSTPPRPPPWSPPPPPGWRQMLAGGRATATRGWAGADGAGVAWLGVDSGCGARGYIVFTIGSGAGSGFATGGAAGAGGLTGAGRGASATRGGAGGRGAD